MSTELFRKVALERLSSPEQLDQMIRVTHPRGWLALSSVVLLISAAVVWSILGTIPTKVSAPGILVRHGGVQVINSGVSGQVRSISVQTGDVVQAGDVVASIFRSDAGDTSPIAYVFSPLPGRIVELKVLKGGAVAPGTPIASIESTRLDLEAVLYVPLAEGKKVQKGQAVQISPSNYRKEEYGYLLGVVRRVAEFPSTRQGMMSVVQNETLIDRLGGNEAPIEVWIDLVPMPGAPGQYQWSSIRGEEEADVQQGTFCTADITVEEQRPISLVIPILKQATGL